MKIGDIPPGSLIARRNGILTVTAWGNEPREPGKGNMGLDAATHNAAKYENTKLPEQTEPTAFVAELTYGTSNVVPMHPVDKQREA